MLAMAERHRVCRHSSSPETEALSVEAAPITLKPGADDIRKLKEDRKKVDRGYKIVCGGSRNVN